MQANRGLSKRSHQTPLHTSLQQAMKIRTPFTARKGTIKDKNRKVLTDQQGIRSRWREYTEELYASPSNPEPPHDNPLELELAILGAEAVTKEQGNSYPSRNAVSYSTSSYHSDLPEDLGN